MFKKEYQGGTHVEVLSASGRDPLTRWKLTGSVSREYVKDVRGYVVTMDGGSSTTKTKMQLPKTDRASLGLVQPYLVLQLIVPDEARVAIDMSVMDSSGGRRRIQMSTSQREVAVTPLNARVPLGAITGEWVNLCIDLSSLVSGLFKTQSFKSLEGITIGGSCMLRRIFTLKTQPPDTTVTELTATSSIPLEEIPKAYQIPSNGATAQTQVIAYANVTSPSHMGSSSATTVSTLGSSSENVAVTNEERPTHIAFGKKVAIPNHILASRKQSGRSALSSRESSADSVKRVGELAVIDGHSLQPRPPSKPADPTLLKVQKRRVRMVSGGKKKPESPSQISKTTALESTDGSGIQTGTSDTDQISAVNIESKLTNNSEQQTPVEYYLLHEDEHLALDALKNKGNSSESYHLSNNALGKGNEEKIDGLNTSGISDDYLNSTSDSQMLNISVASSARASDLDSSVDEVLYLYRSLPRSAERKQPGFKEYLEDGRSADFKDDFVSPVKEAKPSTVSFAPLALVAEVRPRSSHQKNDKPVSPLSQHGDSPPHDQLNETRLSDDYDWRQYASTDGTDLTQSEQSLRTRLANAESLSEQDTPHAFTLGPRAEAEVEGTLSNSVTLSGWTEKFKDAAINPLHDSLDTHDMGGMLSPLSGTLTEEPDFFSDPVKTETQGEELELMYDPQLNCFYDPVTGKYYELAQ